jgi:hypothetical protein
MAMGKRLKTMGLLGRLALCTAGLALVVLECNDPLRVTDPDIVTPANLTDPSVLPTLRAGALGDFTLAYSGSGAAGSGGTVEGMIMYGGLLADEWINSETFPTRIEVDARGPIRTDNATMQDWFRNLHRARRALENAAANYQALASDLTAESGYPEMLALAGYVYIFFAETWCSGVPVSTARPDGSLTYGPPLSTTQLLDTAIARFDAATAAANALTSTSAKNTMLRLAAVGKARALLDRGLGDPAAAAAIVGTVPTSFAYQVQHTENTTRENNGIFNGNVVFERYSVANAEGINGLPFRTGTVLLASGGSPVLDPRTPWERVPANDVGFDNVTPQYDNLRYGDRKAPVTVATGAEARLIQAEAALRAGDTLSNTSAFLTALNSLRAAPPAYLNSTRLGVPAVPALAPLTTADQTAAGGAVKLLFNERARWLWLTGHRLGDLRRLVRQYGFAADAVFPTGPYFKAQQPTYGQDVNFPVPIDELNNPNFVQCIDRLP